MGLGLRLREGLGSGKSGQTFKIERAHTCPEGGVLQGRPANRKSRHVYASTSTQALRLTVSHDRYYCKSWRYCRCVKTFRMVLLSCYFKAPSSTDKNGHLCAKTKLHNARLSSRVASHTVFCTHAHKYRIICTNAYKTSTAAKIRNTKPVINVADLFLLHLWVCRRRMRHAAVTGVLQQYSSKYTGMIRKNCICSCCFHINSYLVQSSPR